MSCKVCGLEHRGWIPCAKAKYLVVHTGSSQDIGSSQGDVGQPTSAQRSGAGDEPELSNQNKLATKHGVYADLEKRKAYRREWMRKCRSAALKP